MSQLCNTTIEFRPFGTKLDIVPIVLGRGHLTLEVRAEVSEVDATISTQDGVPGFRVRRVNTAVDMPVGHTLALAGDYREETETLKRGAPRLMDHPFWGSAFRRTEEVKTETELVFLLTPRFIDAVEAASLRQRPIGGNSTSPSDRDLYLKGHTEVPVCPGGECEVNDGFRNGVGSHPTGQLGSGQRPSQPPVIGVPSFSENKKAPARSRQASGFSWPTR